jgi:hypothetical protein
MADPIRADVVYGLKVIYPEVCYKSIPPTRWELFRAKLWNIWFDVQQAALFGLVFACSAVAAGFAVRVIRMIGGI